jgi:(heptosyl)LPS beta-1,4-glucosyltransferase
MRSEGAQSVQPGGPFEPTRDPRRAPVTVVIPTLAESKRARDAVLDLAWADEVIVVDGGSADDTAAQAQSAGATVFVVSGKTIADQRNAGIAAARNRWVLTLDVDERVSPRLRQEIIEIVTRAGNDSAAYRVRFRNYYLGRELKHGPWGRDSHVRLFTRDRRFVCRRVHEHVEESATTRTLDGTILHYPYRDLAHHAAKIIRYAQWGADDLYARGQRATVGDLISHPAWRLVRDLALFAGWRDGVPGLIAAVMSAFASFLKYAFLYAATHSGER